MKIDNEYATANIEEHQWLRSCGIKYTFVKVDNNNVTWFKYAKTPRLFECLKAFYNKNEYLSDCLEV